MRAVGISVALACLAASAAGEELVEVARGHFNTGVVYFDRGEYGKALREFKNAAEVSPRPEFDFNIGRTYDRLGDAARAVRFYERYVAARPDAADAGETREAIERLQRRVGTLRMAAGPGVEVTMDGEPLERGEGGLVAVTEGPHILVATKAGALPRSVSVQVVAGSEVAVELEPVAPAVVPAPEPAKPSAKVEKTSNIKWIVTAVVVAAVVVIAGSVAIGVAASSSGNDAVAAARMRCPGCFVVEFR